MPCYTPETGYRSKLGRNPETGKWPIVFNAKDGYHDMPVKVPCGHCIGCRLDYSRKWAIRCVLEAQLHRKNCFLTITYDEAHCPKDGNLQKKHMQDFWKRLRKEAGKLRYYMAGEYGEETSRPHYHACIFGWKPDDLQVWKEKTDFNLYTSKTLNDIWGQGYVVVGDVTWDSAAYCARYVLKKLNKKEDVQKAEKQLQKEFVAMSRRPGIAQGWYEKYKDDVYPMDKIVISDKIKVRPPRYFDDRYEVGNRRELEKIKGRRRRKAKMQGEEGEWDRMQVKRKLKEYKINKLTRGYENGNLRMPGQ